MSGSVGGLQWGSVVNATTYPSSQTPLLATAVGPPGAVEVPVGSGLRIDLAGHLTLSLADLPMSASGLAIGEFWNDAGLLAVVTG